MTIKPLFDAITFLLKEHAASAVNPATQAVAHQHAGKLTALFDFLEPVVHVAEDVLPIVLPASAPILAIVEPILHNLEQKVDAPVAGAASVDAIAATVTAPPTATATLSDQVNKQVADIQKTLSDIEKEVAAK